MSERRPPDRARMTHPVVHLWEAAGRPAPNWQGKRKTAAVPPEPRDGVCALTGTSGPVWPLAKVTTTLTTLDRFRRRDSDPAGLALGPAAAWAVRHRDAMLRPHAAVGGAHRCVEGPDLFDALVATASDPAVMPSVPLGQFGAQVLPWARWGRVGCDEAWLAWTDRDAERLGTCRALRRLGFGEAALAEPEPRFVLLAKLCAADRRWVLVRWHDLDPWRAWPAYLAVAARATREPKET